MGEGRRAGHRRRRVAHPRPPVDESSAQLTRSALELELRLRSHPGIRQPYCNLARSLGADHPAPLLRAVRLEKISARCSWHRRARCSFAPRRTDCRAHARAHSVGFTQCVRGGDHAIHGVNERQHAGAVRYAAPSVIAGASDAIDAMICSPARCGATAEGAPWGASLPMPP